MKLSDYKKILVCVLALLMLTAFIGCTPSVPPTSSSNESSEPPESIGNETVTITDLAGREVEVPAIVSSVALTWNPLVTIITSLGKGELIAGLGTSTEFISKAVPGYEKVVLIGRKPDLELLAKLKPDVFIHKAGDTPTLEAVSELGIAAIGVNTEDTEDLFNTTRLLGKMFGVESRAEEVIAYYNEKIALADSLVKDLPAEKKKTAIVMGREIGKVAHGGMLQSSMIEAAGGISLARDIESKETWPVIGTEQIFKWNPDVIFLANSVLADYTAEDLKEDVDMARLNAVKNDQLFIIPTRLDSWDFPGIQSSLGILWMLNQMYPDIYSDDDFIKEVDGYYSLAFGKTFDRKWLGY